MIAQTPWIERTFNFDFPAGLYTCLVERSRGTPARIEEMVSHLSEEIITEKPNQKWSIKEHIGHLTDLESLHEGRIDDFIEGKEMLRAADMSNKKTVEAEHNNKPIQILLSEFRSARMRFIARLEATDESLISRISLHPRLQKPLRLVDMVFFSCEHDDHHLAKMRGIIRIFLKIQR